MNVLSKEPFFYACRDECFYDEVLFLCPYYSVVTSLSAMVTRLEMIAKQRGFDLFNYTFTFG